MPQSYKALLQGNQVTWIRVPPPPWVQPRRVIVRTFVSYNRSVKSKQFLKLLKAAHAEIIRNRGKGGHYLVKLNGKSTTVPVHGDTDYDPIFLDDICKQLNTRLKDIQK